MDLAHAGGLLHAVDLFHQDGAVRASVGRDARVGDSVSSVGGVEGSRLLGARVGTLDERRGLHGRSLGAQRQAQLFAGLRYGQGGVRIGAVQIPEERDSAGID